MNAFSVTNAQGMDEMVILGEPEEIKSEINQPNDMFNQFRLPLKNLKIKGKKRDIKPLMVSDLSESFNRIPIYTQTETYFTK